MFRQAHEADDEGGPVGDGGGVQGACVLAEFERAGFAWWGGWSAGWVERRGREGKGKGGVVVGTVCPRDVGPVDDPAAFGAAHQRRELRDGHVGCEDLRPGALEGESGRSVRVDDGGVFACVDWGVLV